MRRLANFIRLVIISNLLPIGASRAQDDVFTEEPQSDRSVRALGVDDEPQVEPTPNETPQAEPPVQDVAPMAPTPIETPQTETPTDDELIVDPELSAIAPRQQTDSNFKAMGEACPPPGEVKVLLRSRFATDLEWEEREEVWEANQLFLVETNLRTSDRLRFSAGIRVRHQFAALESDTSEAESTRYQFDAMPTAGYVDATLTDGLHLRAGFQMMQLGPMDVFSASNFLAAMDLRNGPTTMPEAAEIAQLALRVDADPLSWLSLRLYYLPFYQPHLVSATESDYAQFPASRVEEVFYHFLGDPGAADYTDEYRRYFKKFISRSARSEIVESNDVMFLPDPDLTTPQGALRITVHGSEGEVGLTTGTAIERLPASYIPPEEIENIRTGFSSYGNMDETELQQLIYEFDADAPSSVMFYNRFYVFAIDATTDVGPIQLGVETAYQLDRTMLAVKKDFWAKGTPYFAALLEPGAWPIPGKTDLVQLTLHGEFLEGSEWIVALEGVAGYSLYVPPYEPEREWLSLHRGRYLFGGASLIRWSPADSGWTFEVSAVVTNGLNYVVAPRIETRLIAELYAEVGVFLVGASAPSGTYIDQEIVTGYLYEDIDQVFVGLRWLP